MSRAGLREYSRIVVFRHVTNRIQWELNLVSVAGGGSVARRRMDRESRLNTRSSSILPLHHGMMSFCPTLREFRFSRLFIEANASTLEPCRRAMIPSVSPGATV